MKGVKMDSQKTGRFIAEQRKNRRMTQKELAARLHVTDKAVSKWERGISLPSVDLLGPLSGELGVSVLELLDGQRREEESIDLQTANTILAEAIRQLEKAVRRKRMILFLVFALLLLCVWISGLLLWNQGLLLDERGMTTAQLYYGHKDDVLDWLRFAVLSALLWISGIAAFRKK